MIGIYLPVRQNFPNQENLGFKALQMYASFQSGAIKKGAKFYLPPS